MISPASTDNSINGTPSCANTWLLDTVLRKSWNFTGYITSDCGAVVDIFENHHASPTQEQAAAWALSSGTDFDCGSGYDSFIFCFLFFFFFFFFPFFSSS